MKKKKETKRTSRLAAPKTPEFIVHCILVFRNKKDWSKYMTKTSTLSGTDISRRIETLFTVEAKQWSNEWELRAFSHAFLPFAVEHQI